jgi:hypothetical protein
MGSIPHLIGNTADIPETVVYTFPTGNTDTSVLNGQSDIRTWLYNKGLLRSLRARANVTINIPNGATVGSSNPLIPGLQIANFNARDKVILNVLAGGRLLGASGAYGAGGGDGSTAGSTGGTGGTSLSVASNCTVINNGNIYGGGGGGGGGGGYHKAGVPAYCVDSGVPCCATAVACGCNPPTCPCGTYGLCFSYPQGIAAVDAIDQSGFNGGVGQGYNQTNTNGTTSTNSAGSGGNGGTYGTNGGAGGVGGAGAGALGVAGKSLSGKAFVNGGSGISTGTLGPQV